MNIKVHVKGIKGSGLIEPGEEAGVMFNCLLEVDGHIIEEVTEVEVSFSGGSITTVRPHLIPGTFEVVTHNTESWPKLIKSLDDRRDATAGSGRLIAKVPADE